MDKALENIKDGVKVGSHLVNAVRCADDQAMVANSKAGLQCFYERISCVFVAIAGVNSAKRPNT